MQARREKLLQIHGSNTSHVPQSQTFSKKNVVRSQVLLASVIKFDTCYRNFWEEDIINISPKKIAHT